MPSTPSATYYLVRDKQRTIYGWDLDKKTAQNLADKLKRGGNRTARAEPISAETRAHYEDGPGVIPDGVVRGRVTEFVMGDVPGASDTPRADALSRAPTKPGGTDDCYPLEPGPAFAADGTLKTVKAGTAAPTQPLPVVQVPEKPQADEDKEADEEIPSVEELLEDEDDDELDDLKMP